VDPKELAVPGAPTENEEAQLARKMSDDLIAAKVPQQEELLGKYKEGKGSAYTLALAGAIPRLSGESKTKARDALAERFTRMTAATLRTELKDDDPEIRRAASLACAMKDDKSHVPDLIPLLEDPEPLVARAAHAALRSLSNQDFGPAKDASAKDRAQAIEAWKGWWAKQERK
jgi:HEAT repeat protein